LKLKEAAAEPQHFNDPHEQEGTLLVEAINYHFANLVEDLRDANLEKAGFEASWLAHALVDGLTPAHHYPYEAELAKIRGEAGSTRNTVAKKFYVKGKNRRDTLKKSWLVVGAKGLLTTHTMFEAGMAMVLAGFRPNPRVLHILPEQNVTELFLTAAHEVAEVGMYDYFYAKGWTTKLVLQVRTMLGPKMVEVVASAWLLAASEAFGGSVAVEAKKRASRARH
jgi:hypothetical protein